MKKNIIALISFIFLSCASFKEKKTAYQKINSTNTNILNGTYSIFASKSLKDDFFYFDNANEKFYRKYGRGNSDTIKFDTINGGLFKVLIKNEQEINLEFIRKNKVIKRQTLNYKIMKDGFLYIKNRNTIISGIPYLLGGVDVKKVRLSLTENNDLIIDDIFDSSGALLLIFGDAKVWENTNIYKKIN